jgi:transcriptional regulator with XRE-family HTH domain
VSATTPDEVLKALKRYLKESNETEHPVAALFGVNHHTLHRLLTKRQSPKKAKLALTAGFLSRVGCL